MQIDTLTELIGMTNPDQSEDIRFMMALDIVGYSWGRDILEGINQQTVGICKTCSHVYFINHGCDICAVLRRTVAETLRFHGCSTSDQWDAFFNGQQDPTEVILQQRLERAMFIADYVCPKDFAGPIVPVPPMAMRRRKFKDSDYPEYIKIYLQGLPRLTCELLTYEMQAGVLGWCNSCFCLHFSGVACNVCGNGMTEDSTEQELDHERNERAKVFCDALQEVLLYAEAVVLRQMFNGYRASLSTFGISMDDVKHNYLLMNGLREVAE